MRFIDARHFKDDDDVLVCRNCEWTGERKESVCQRFVSSPESWQALAGRDGWIYKCPVCDWRVDEEWLRIS